MPAEIVEYILRMRDEASAALTDTAEAAEEAAESAGVADASLGGVAAAATATAGAVVAATAAWFGFMSVVAESRNEIGGMAARTGLAAETLSGLALASASVGVELSELEGPLIALPKMLRDAAEGTDPVAMALKELGLNAGDADAMLADMDGTVRDIVDRLSKVENPGKRAAIATDLFGESGTRLLLAFGESGALDHYIAQAERFGIKTGPEAAKAAQDWHRQVVALQGVLAGMADTLAGAFGADGGAAAALETFTFSLIYTSTLSSEILQTLEQRFQRLRAVVTGLWEDGLDSEALEGATLSVDNASTLWEDASAAAFKAAEAFQGFSDATIGVGDAPDPTTTISTGLGTTKTKADEATDALSKLLEKLSADVSPFGDAIGDLESALDGLRDELGLGATGFDVLDRLLEDVEMAFAHGAISATEYAEALDLVRLKREALTDEEHRAALDAFAALEAQAEALANEAAEIGSTTGGGIPDSAGGAASAATSFAAGDVAGGVSSIASSLGPLGAIIAAVIGALETLGTEGAESINERIDSFHDSILASFAELPDVVSHLLLESVKFIPDLVAAIMDALPEIVVEITKAITQQAIYMAAIMPVEVAANIISGISDWWQESRPEWWNNPEKSFGEAIGDWWRSAWQQIKEAISEAFSLDGFSENSEGGFLSDLGAGLEAQADALGNLIGFQSGGYVPRTGLAILHQGERVIAKGGPKTGAARRNMEKAGAGYGSTGGGSVNLTINTTTLDRDAIPALVRSIERVFGVYGRGRSPLFVGG